MVVYRESHNAGIQGVSFCQYTGCFILPLYSVFHIAGMKGVS